MQHSPHTEAWSLSPSLEEKDSCSSDMTVWPQSEVDAYPSESKPKRKRVKSACTACKHAHATCDEERPCKRCIRRGTPDECCNPESSPAPRTQSPPPSRPRQRKMFLEYVPTLSSQKKAKFVECRTEDAHLAASGEMTHAWVNTAALTPAEFATVQSQTALAPSPSFPSSIPTQFDDACDSPYNSDTSLEDYSWVQPRPTHPVAHFLCPQTETQHFYPAAACVSHYGATYPESWNSYHQFKSDLPTNATDYLDDPEHFLRNATYYQRIAQLIPAVSLGEEY